MSRGFKRAGVQPLFRAASAQARRRRASQRKHCHYKTRSDLSQKGIVPRQQVKAVLVHAYPLAPSSLLSPQIQKMALHLRVTSVVYMSFLAREGKRSASRLLTCGFNELVFSGCSASAPRVHSLVAKCIHNWRYSQMEPEKMDLAGSKPFLLSILGQRECLFSQRERVFSPSERVFSQHERENNRIGASKR